MFVRVFKPPIHLSIPPDLVPVPPPPLSPPWLHHSVYPAPLDSPPLISESNTWDSFQLDHEVLTRTPSQFDNPNALQGISMSGTNSAIDANVIPHEFLLSFSACPIVIPLIIGGEFFHFRTSTSHTYQLFVERPLKITFTWNIVHLQYMNITSARLQIYFPNQIMFSLENGNFSLFSFLVVNPFGYIGSQCGCISSLDCCGVVLVEVLIGKQPTKRIISLIIRVGI
jgi:hypothetical protein